MSLIIENFESAKEISAAGSAVIRTLLYFDIFGHPLTAQEICRLIQVKEQGDDETLPAINELEKGGLICQQDGFYYLNDNVSGIEKRMQGEARAAKSLRTAKKYSRLIAGFPFVRAIALSGSLSKNYMDPNSDIDYFIITAPGRMWLARTLLILFKKIFLLNSRKYFCVNYFLSEDSLEVPDRNIFTATEIAFLLPTYNYALYGKFRKANAWSGNFLPHFPLRGKSDLITEDKKRFKTFLEKILSGKAGEWLDTYLFRLTLKYWKKKFSHFDEATFDFRLRSRKNVSKHHPLGFQEKVLTGYAEKMTAFSRMHDISLHEEDPLYA